MPCGKGDPGHHFFMNVPGWPFCFFLLFTGLLASTANESAKMAILLRERKDSSDFTTMSPCIYSPSPKFKITPKGKFSPSHQSFLSSRSRETLEERFTSENTDYKRRKIDVEDIRNLFVKYSLPLTDESLYACVLGVINIFERYSTLKLNSDSQRKFKEELSRFLGQDNAEYDFLFISLATGIIFRQYQSFRLFIQILPQFHLPKPILDKFSKKVFDLLFSAKIKVSELKKFLPAFDIDGLLSFNQFAAHLKTYRKTTVELSEIRGHLDYAFSLVDLSSATIDTCIANISLAHDISAVGYLFHSFFRNAAVPDSVLQDAITRLLDKNELKVVEIVSITIAASHFRPECFEKLYRYCDKQNKLESLLPYLDYSHKTVFRVVQSKLQHLKDAVTLLKKAITRAASLNIPCDFLILLLSKNMLIEGTGSVEDYLVEMSKTTNFECIVKSLNLIDDKLDHDYLINELDFNSSSLEDFLIVCTRSPLLFQFPLQYLPRLASQNPKVVSKQMSISAAQNQFVASALKKAEFDESIESYWLALGLINYAASDVRGFVEFLIQSHEYQLVADLARYFRLESSYTCVSFEQSLKRDVTLTNLESSIPALTINDDYEEYLVILV